MGMPSWRWDVEKQLLQKLEPLGFLTATGNGINLFNIHMDITGMTGAYGSISQMHMDPSAISDQLHGGIPLVRIPWYRYTSWFHC